MPGLLGAVAIVLVFPAERTQGAARVRARGRLPPRTAGRGSRPGLVYVIPGIEKALRIDLRTITMDIPSQDVITKDNVSLKVNAVLYFRVIDSNRAVVEVENYLFATSQLAQTTLRSVCGEAQLDELLAEREKINAHLQSIIDQHTEPWGIKVVQVAVKHIDLPEEIAPGDGEAGRGERERRAKVIAAEGEFQAAQRLADASAIMAKEPIALQLRFLQTLVEVASGEQLDHHLPGADRHPAAVPRGPGSPLHLMRLAELDYPLPEALIAQAPAPERAAARLLVLDRGGAPLRHAHVGDLPGFLRAGDVLVVNDTRVIPARVSGRRPSGGRLELLFVAPLGKTATGRCSCAARRAPASASTSRAAGASGSPRSATAAGASASRSTSPRSPGSNGWVRYRCRPTSDAPRRRPIASAIRPCTRACRARWRRRPPGSTERGAARCHRGGGRPGGELTLHVGPGTFLPIRTDDLAHHVMAPEPSDIPSATVEAIGAARARGGRVVAVGTTTVRALESAWADGTVRAGSRRGGALHAARPPLPGGGRAAHELPPAALDPARAGGGVRRLGPHPRGLRRGGAARLPLLQLRRRHAHHVSAPFAFEVVRVDPSGARLGRLTTAHGVVDTPAFMPVATTGR